MANKTTGKVKCISALPFNDQKPNSPLQLHISMDCITHFPVFQMVYTNISHAIHCGIIDPNKDIFLQRGYDMDFPVPGARLAEVPPIKGFP